MASASSTSAKNLFIDSKLRLAERVQVNINNIGSVCRQVLRGSRSADLLSHSARNLALQEHAIKNTEENLQRLNILATHLSYQCEAISKSANSLEDVKEQKVKMVNKLKLTLEWAGGSEMIFGNIRKRTVELSDEVLKGKDIRSLLKWLKADSGFLTHNPELFFSGDTVRPGILVVINDSDWELCNELDYQLQDGDYISFISTLHGG
ncbi:Ubiquitin-related modifier 1-like protein [Armadillidium nasatum]|uniref:Ubiquitin-related modifier 1 homolog n=1 Tax=Armadillidium nasatum TaxID=96803 RepID=A0A5N5SX83_9CRUS|nr:Ubiquitin-related modifier 1-like protein [Armadillidium nasatum]